MRLARRAGFTLIELAVVLVAGGLVAAAAGSMLRRQQRFFASASAIVQQRVHLRDATGILPGELRALAPGAGDVLAFSDSSLDIRATIGSGIACDTIAGGVGIDLAPPRSAAGVRLGAFIVAPQAGDVAMVFHAGATDAAADDGWAAAEVAGAAPEPSACAASPLRDPSLSGSGAPLRLRFVTGVSLPAGARPGAFVRLLRRVRYRFYRSGTGDWYLGYAEWDGAAFGVVQPVTGPFASYARGGLSLRYFDAAGTELSSGSAAERIARVTVVARGEGRTSLAGTGIMAGDSQSVGVRVRNR